MITNLEELKNVLSTLNSIELKRIKNTDKEFIIISLHVFNVGYYATIKLTNKYKNCTDPDYLFYTDEIKKMLNFNTI